MFSYMHQAGDVIVSHPSWPEVPENQDPPWLEYQDEITFVEDRYIKASFDTPIPFTVVDTDSDQAQATLGRIAAAFEKPAQDPFMKLWAEKDGR